MKEKLENHFTFPNISRWLTIVGPSRITLTHTGPLSECGALACMQQQQLQSSTNAPNDALEHTHELLFFSMTFTSITTFSPPPSHSPFITSHTYISTRLWGCGTERERERICWRRYGCVSLERWWRAVWPNRFLIFGQIRKFCGKNETILF